MFGVFGKANKVENEKLIKQIKSILSEFKEDKSKVETDEEVETLLREMVSTLAIYRKEKETNKILAELKEITEKNSSLLSKIQGKLGLGLKEIGRASCRERV